MHGRPQSHTTSSLFLSNNNNDNTEASFASGTTWNGEVTSNSKDGSIRGCLIQPAPNGVVVPDQDALDRIVSSSKYTDTLTSNTEWIVQIDGVEADLGRFSLAIYKKLLKDAQQQQFQGYRRGTIPPPLLSTYKAYTMDECARETILEALEQNQIRPFDTCRNEMILCDFSFPPAATTTTSKKSKGKNNKGKRKSSKSDSDMTVSEEATIPPTTTTATTTTTVDTTADAVSSDTTTDVNSSSNSNTRHGWTTYATMKEAIDVGGWQPGQSFSFVAKHVRGQRSLSNPNAKLGAGGIPQPLGVDY